MTTDYEDAVAHDKRIDRLRAKMVCVEDKKFSQDYLDPEKHSIANAVQVFFRDGRHTDKIAVEYPIGHRRRRQEGIPVLQRKAHNAFTAHYGADKAAKLMELFANRERLEATPVHAFVSHFAK